MIRQFLKNELLIQRSLGYVDSHWEERTQDAIASPDNLAIARVADAGVVDGYTIVMHNGVRVCANGYYGKGILNLLIRNNGVHEPQEERAFNEIVALLPSNCTMLELGSYWAFYSLSLLQERPAAKCFLIDPQFECLETGRFNFELNNRTGYFEQAFIGADPANKNATTSVDLFCETHSIDSLDILHADIQGYEEEMLWGASEMLSRQQITYVFISTHSNALHANCIKLLEDYGYHILASANLLETFSHDGLIVAKASNVLEPASLQISKKSN